MLSFAIESLVIPPGAWTSLRAFSRREILKLEPHFMIRTFANKSAISETSTSASHVCL